jgi:3D (Asp-Asp-Asp) domain-containing protein
LSRADPEIYPLDLFQPDRESRARRFSRAGERRRFRKRRIRWFLTGLAAMISISLFMPRETQALSAPRMPAPAAPVGPSPSSVRPAEHVWVWATAYCPTCAVCDTGDTTATGRRAFSRGVAVAARGKRFAPLGSRVHVPGFGWLRVDDTGGEVRSDQIDVRLRSHRQAVLWGRRRMQVRVIAAAR